MPLPGCLPGHRLLGGSRVCRLLGGPTSLSRRPRPDLSLPGPSPHEHWERMVGRKFISPCTAPRLGQETAESGSGRHTGRANLTKKTPSCSNYLGCSPTAPVTSAFLGHTDSQEPLSLGAIRDGSRSEEKGKGTIPHPRDFCLLRLLDLTPTSDSLPPSWVFNSFLSNPSCSPNTNSQVNSSTEDACFLNS